MYGTTRQAFFMNYSSVPGCKRPVYLEVRVWIAAAAAAMRSTVDTCLTKSVLVVVQVFVVGHAEASHVDWQTTR